MYHCQDYVSLIMYQIIMFPLNIIYMNYRKISGTGISDCLGNFLLKIYIYIFVLREIMYHCIIDYAG